MIKGLVLSLEGAARSTQTIWVPSTSWRVVSTLQQFYWLKKW
jgi:hypothetical protein